MASCLKTLILHINFMKTIVFWLKIGFQKNHFAIDSLTFAHMFESSNKSLM